jgi:hypothetical protein
MRARAPGCSPVLPVAISVITGFVVAEIFFAVYEVRGQGGQAQGSLWCCQQNSVLFYPAGEDTM